MSVFMLVVSTAQSGDECVCEKVRRGKMGRGEWFARKTSAVCARVFCGRAEDGADRGHWMMRYN